MKYIVILTPEKCIKKHYRNKLDLLFIRLYCYIKKYEIL